MMIDELPPTLTRVDPATQRSAEYIRADVAQARIAAAEDMATQAVQAAVTKQAQLDAANARIAQLEAAMRWVSVDERLPEPLVDVFVIDSDGYWSQGWLSKPGAWYVGLHPIPVTHWMPPPPPPVTDATP